MLPAVHPFGTAINIASGHIFRVSLCSTWSIVVIFSVFFCTFSRCMVYLLLAPSPHTHTPCTHCTCNVFNSSRRNMRMVRIFLRWREEICSFDMEHALAPHSGSWARPYGRGAKQCFKLLSLFGQRKKLQIPLSLSRCTIIYLFSQSRDRPLSAANGFQFRSGANTSCRQ